MDRLRRILGVVLYIACLPMVTTSPLSLRVRRDAEEMYPPGRAEENLGATGGYFIQGDILLQRRRNAVNNFHLTWVNRTVPYLMDALDSDSQHKVLRAMEEIMNKSCVRFVQRNRERDYVKIVKSGGCFSSVGRTGGPQPLYLASNCYYHGVIVHELMHALGFWHEHSRPDRDDYISILWDNIVIDHRSNFEKRSSDSIDVLGAPYDYGSIMHYRNNAFAIDGNHITINHTHPLPPGVHMGQRVGLSDIDVLKLKRLYRCNITHCPSSGTPRHGGKTENSTMVGAEVRYRCQQGYSRYGSRARSCLDQGFWSGQLPSCLPDPGRLLHMCDFDSKNVSRYCGWVNVSSPDEAGEEVGLTWNPGKGGTVSQGTGPEEDHTMGSDIGGYIYLEASNGEPGDRARLLSPQLFFGPQQGPLCMMFYYSMHGKDMGTLNVYQRGQSGSFRAADLLLFSMQGDQGKDWHLAAITLPLPGIFQMVVEAVKGSSFHSDMAVDDLLIGPCSSLLQLEAGEGADSFHCSFDSGWCGMQQDTHGDDFNWTRQSGATLTYNTGPDCDPLDCQSGVYAYIESSDPQRYRDTARLTTPLLHGDGSRCLEFFWHMYGEAMGNLTVILRQLNGSEVNLWFRSGPQGNQWHSAQVHIPDTPRFYKLVFEGTVGPSYTSDIAVDNIEIYTGGCQGVVHNDCTFQHNLCSWHNEGQRLWKRNRGNTPTPGTGPTLDHNNSSLGYYLFVESSRTFPSETARLTSGQVLGNLTGYCLHFWYHMHGEHVGVLSVLTTPSDTPADAAGPESTLWQRSGDQGDVWHQQLLYFISPGQQDFEIIFEARLAGGGKEDIAIDDLTLHAGQCETPQLSSH